MVSPVLILSIEAYVPIMVVPSYGVVNGLKRKMIYFLSKVRSDKFRRYLPKLFS
jgi:hypothetical protein